MLHCGHTFLRPLNLLEYELLNIISMLQIQSADIFSNVL